MASMQLENQVREKLTANLNNQTPHEIQLGRYLDFSKGAPVRLPPPPAIGTIKPGEEVTFKGLVSKGAVVYAGSVINESRTLPAAWVLAWDTIALPTPNKVYVTCGPRDIIEKMNDDEILQKLNESTSPVGSHADPTTKSAINAVLSQFIPGGDFLKATFAQL